MNKNLIKKLIIFFGVIVIAIVLGIIIISITKPPYEQEINIEDEGVKETIKTEKEKVESVEDRERIYMVEQCISSYLDTININNSSYYMYDESGNQEKSVDENEIILNLLTKEYTSKNNITKNNIENYVDKLDKDVFFVPLQMKYINNGDIYQYAMIGYITDFDYNIIKEVGFKVNLDMSATKTGDPDLSFTIEPINGEINNIDEVQLEIKLTSVEKNDYNIVQYITTNTEEDCKRYLDYYKKMALSNPEEAYNRLDEEYRNLRFGSLDAYKQYIEENKKDIQSIQISQYMTNTENGVKQNIAKDKYGKIYIFEGVDLFDLSIKLDTYTIETATFKEQYENGNEEVKVQMNINKFILMINNQDYKAAYNLLDDNFKNNYFNTLEEFIDYVKVYMYRYNNLELRNFNVNGNVYICDVTLTDATNGKYIDETKGTGGSGYLLERTFYIQLTGDKDFKISFEM